PGPEHTIDPTNMLYVLSYRGAGTQRSDYRLDVYDADTGQHVVRNTSIAVGRMVVDKFRGLYSLNYETVKGSPVVEPSVSVWAPSPPLAAPPPHVMLAECIGAIERLALPAGLKQTFLASLLPAWQALQRGQRQAAQNQLQAFLNKIAAQRGKQLSVTFVDGLTSRVQKILAAL